MAVKMNYQQTLDYMYSQLPMFHRIGAAAYKPDLKNTIQLCELIGNPQNNFKTIHVAGTNGKGSTSHLLASIFQEAGYKTGLYTSPHLKDFRERIRVNGEKISRNFVVDFIKNNKVNAEEIKPSFFELTVAMAFSFFHEEEVDFAIIETGLGGRLDSTNVITPELSIITNISLDHQNLLGKELSTIAGEKAGIIKEGIPIVIGERESETDFVFIEKAKKEKSKIIFASDDYSTSKVKTIDNYIIVNVMNKEEIIFPELKSALIGNYQLKNISTVIASVEIINENKIADLPNTAVYEGIKNVVKNTFLMGRWQILNKKPLIVCDTAHNESGLKLVMEMIESSTYRNLHMVFGMVNDKDVDKVLAMLPQNAIYYFCKANIPRALDVLELEEKAGKFNLVGNVFNDVPSALNSAKNNAQIDDMIFIGGSTFIVADAL